MVKGSSSTGVCRLQTGWRVGCRTCARTTSRLSTCITSSMFRGPTMSIASASTYSICSGDGVANVERWVPCIGFKKQGEVRRPRTFLQMSMLGEDKARRMSISISWTTLEWCFFSSDRRSSTMSFTCMFKAT